MAKGATASIVHVPPGAGGLKQGPDDFLVAGGTVDALLSLAEPWVEEDSKTGAKKSQATRLVELALESGAEFWHDFDGRPFASVPIHGHRQHHSLTSRVMKDWLSALYYFKTGNAIGGQALADAISVLRAEATFHGSAYQTHVRMAEFEGRIYLDLCDESWRSVEINVDGWRVVEDPPVRFRRARAMLALPIPEAGGRLDELRKFLNIRDDDWPLVAAWLVAAARPKGPYPHLDLLGEQGSAKTTAARYLRLLIDPNTALARSDPREARDLAIAANNGWFVSLDNLSGLPIWLSDALCRLSTGGGFATRSLYTDDEESIFEAQRPVILNGINEVATRSDLLDRGIAIYMQPLHEEQRKTEAEMDAAFNFARPRILGALLDALVVGLQRLSAVKLDRLPRMADFATWSVAAEPGLGIPPGSFLAAYDGSREAAHDSAVEHSAIGPWVLGVVDSAPFQGTATELLDLAGDDLRRRKDFPSTPRTLANAVRRLASDLRAIGVAFSEWREGKNRKRMLRLERISEASSAASASSAREESETRPQESHEDPEDQQLDFWEVADAADDADAEPLTNTNSVPEVLEL